MSQADSNRTPARIRVESVGSEGVKVLVVESLLTEPEPLVEVAQGSVYGAPQVKSFPGLRTPAPGAYIRLLIETLTPLLQDVFGLQGWRTVSAVGDFSLVTLRPDQLAPRQRIPHTDGQEPGLLALLHYLTAGDCFGTSFYRHRATGFERVTEDRRASYQTTLAAEMQRTPLAGYSLGDGPLFERTGSFGGVFNRLIAYQGHALHSGDVPSDFAFQADPRLGRLTANTFVVMRPSSSAA